MRVQSYADGLARTGAMQAARAAVSSAAAEGQPRGRRGADRPKRLAERDLVRPGPRGDAAGRAFEDHAPTDPHMALASTLARLTLAAGQAPQTSRRVVIAAYADEA